MPQEYNEDFVLLRAKGASEQDRNRWKSKAAAMNMKFTEYITWALNEASGHGDQSTKQTRGKGKQS